MLYWFGYEMHMEEDSSIRKCCALIAKGTWEKSRSIKTWNEVVKRVFGHRGNDKEQNMVIFCL